MTLFFLAQKTQRNAAVAEHDGVNVEMPLTSKDSLSPESSELRFPVPPASFLHRMQDSTFFSFVLMWHNDCLERRTQSL